MSKGFLPKAIRLSWQEIDKACRVVSKKVLMDHFKPDLCVAISRGGFPPARIICDLLNVRNLACIKIEYYSDINETLSEPRLVYSLNADVKGKCVLVVDDVADRGDSLILARKHIQELGASAIKVATLHYKPWTRIKPDYYARKYESWIVYPWEVTETVKKVVSKFRQQGKSMSEIRKALLQIKITDAEMRGALNERP